MSVMVPVHPDLRELWDGLPALVRPKRASAWARVLSDVLISLGLAVLGGALAGYAITLS